jgi:hypothetical protein
MRALLGAVAVVCFNASSWGQAVPVILPRTHITGGKALQAPPISQRTTSQTVVAGQTGVTAGSWSGREITTTGQCPPGGLERRRVIVVPQGGYFYDSSALRDLADAEWAKVRLMEQELRQKEEQARKEYDLRMAEIEAQRQQLLLKSRQGSWDRATAIYPALLDPKSKIRVWYEHLLKRAREMTDRWGAPVRVEELDAPDYPEIFAHRAAKEAGIKPLPLPPPSAEAAGPAAVTAESKAGVGEPMPD